MSKCLVAEYETNATAKIGLEKLEESGLGLSEVSVVSNAEDSDAECLDGLHEESQNQDATASANRSTSLGMLIGGTVAAPIAAGTMVGPFIIAGPLVGMAIGAAVGSLLGMERWGVAHDVSAEYEQRVKSGSVLIIVHDVDDRQLSDAESFLKTTGPKSVEKYAQSWRH